MRPERKNMKLNPLTKSQIKIGTRGSKLALFQAELVKSRLVQLYPNLHVQIIKIKTTGDVIHDTPIEVLGPGIFTREIEKALLDREIDLAVHSAKDMATKLPEGLALGGVLTREDPCDCLVARDGRKLRELPTGAKIGTSSLRRKAQLRRLRADLQISDIRGNVDTRIRKIQGGEYDGMVIALAGLKRLMLNHFVTEVFHQDDFLPQAGQGTLAIEIRKDDVEISELIKPLNDPETMTALLAERSFLRELEGGCQIPAGISSRQENGILTLTGGIFSPTENKEVRKSLSGSAKNPETLGKNLAQLILKFGGAEILSEIRNEK